MDRSSSTSTVAKILICDKMCPSHIKQTAKCHTKQAKLSTIVNCSRYTKRKRHQDNNAIKKDDPINCSNSNYFRQASAQLINHNDAMFTYRNTIVSNQLSSSLIRPNTINARHGRSVLLNDTSTTTSTSTRSATASQQLATLTSILSLLFGICILSSVNNLSALRNTNTFNSVEAIRPTTTHINACHVYNGESVAILEITESRGSEINQSTVPLELPIKGSVSNDEIELKIETETYKYFRLQGKQLKLLRPLDRDGSLRENGTSSIASIYLQVLCTDKRNQNKKIIPVLVKVVDLNDNAPVFSQPTYTTSASELLPVGSVVYDQIFANDFDSGNNGLIDYYLVPSLSSSADNDGHTSGDTSASTSTANMRQQVTNGAMQMTTTVNPVTTVTSRPTVVPIRITNRSLPAGQSTVTVPAYAAMSSPSTSSSSPVIGSIGTTNPSQAVTATTITTTTSTTTVASNSSLAADDDMMILHENITNNAEDDDESATFDLATTTGNPDMTDGEQLIRGSDDNDAPMASFSLTAGRRMSGAQMSSTTAATTTQQHVRTVINRRRKRSNSNMQTSQFSKSNNRQQQPQLQLQQRQFSSRQLVVTPPSAQQQDYQVNNNKNVEQQHDPMQQAASEFNNPWRDSYKSNAHKQIKTPAMPVDGYEYFTLELSPNTGRPVIKLKKSLDYETDKILHLTIKATDKSLNERDRLSSTATLVVKVLDGDDQGPVFVLDNNQASSVQCLNLNYATNGADVTLANNNNFNVNSDNIAKMVKLNSGSQRAKLDPSPSSMLPPTKFTVNGADQDHSGGGHHNYLGANQPIPSAAAYYNNQNYPASQISQATNGNNAAHSGAQLMRRSGLISHQIGATNNIMASRQHSYVTNQQQQQQQQLQQQAISRLQQQQQQQQHQLSSLMDASTVIQAASRYQDGATSQGSGDDIMTILETGAGVSGSGADSDLVIVGDDHTMMIAANINDDNNNNNNQNGQQNNFTSLVIQPNQQSDLAMDPLLQSDNPDLYLTTATAIPPLTMIKSIHNAAAGNCITLDHAQTDATATMPMKSMMHDGPVEYRSTIMSGDVDYNIKILPQAIKAQDRDELNAQIRYTFLNGTPSNYSDYFHINPSDGTIKQIQPVDRSVVKRFTVWLQAQEQTEQKFSAEAKLTIEVVATDKNPPVLEPNSYEGIVEENSPVGTMVMVNDRSQATMTLLAPGKQADLLLLAGAKLTGSQIKKQQDKYRLTNGQMTGAPINARVPLRIFVSDIDLIQSGDSEAQSQAAYEFETTNQAFKVNKEGYLLVNQANLDRDAPNPSVHIFQVTARQVGIVSSKSVSAPIRINVTLADVDDNAPTISSSSLVPLRVPATTGGTRTITYIKGVDLDEDKANSKIFYSIYHVSNNGRDKFRIDQDTGKLETLGKFNAGEQYSVTLQASDKLNRISQGILEIFITQGPNTGPPVFHNDRLSVEISEGISLHSQVVQISATDPENEPIRYSIVDGNINNDFVIDTNTGWIQVNNKLDREEVSAYNLLVEARDQGGLASSATVLVTITDINDENPRFTSGHYTFRVEEGISQQVIGQIVAHDADSGDNGDISYSLSSKLEGSNKFQIDERTGELTVLEPLDYESEKVHNLVVTATDHGDHSRLSTASVTVKVVDKQDELPKFDKHYITVSVTENVANHKLVQVVASDADTVPQITYTLRQGDSSLFSVDPITGWLQTVKGLDYEQAKRHTLIIGTVENQNPTISTNQHDSKTASTTCQVEVLVNDANDNVPIFYNSPLPVRIQDSVPLGSLVTTLQAVDNDGMEPNNQIRYEIVGRNSDKSWQYFMIDPTTGTISVKDDLRKDLSSETRLVIKARDLGQPSLSSTTTLTIFIDHLAEISPESSVGFADTQFTVEVEENSQAHTLIKVLPVINKPKLNFPISCEIVSGNELGKFYIMVNDQRDCEIHTMDNTIDYEQKTRFILTIRLNTIGGSSKTMAQVNVNILDRNDNKPMFKLHPRYSHITGGRFLTAVANDAPSDTQIIQLQAVDLDSSTSNGLVTYEILAESDLDGRFKIDPSAGILRTSRPVEDVALSRLPLKIQVVARDNPDLSGSPLYSLAEVVINLIDDRHRIALVLKDTPPGRVLDTKEELLSIIQERTGLIPGLEKAESLKIQRNGSIDADVTGTDAWFYLIEPGTFRIVPSDDSRVKTTLFDTKAQNSLLDIVVQTLGFNAARVRHPYVPVVLSRIQQVTPMRLGLTTNDFGSALIALALLIAIFGIFGIMYQCRSWSKHYDGRNPKKLGPHHQSSYYQSGSSAGTTPRKLSTISRDYIQIGPGGLFQAPPRMSNMPDPIYMDHQQHKQQPNTLKKEYETQMLKMTVPFDDSFSVDES